MAGDIEVGICDVCKQERVPLSRKYYYYEVKCDCCNRKEDNHFQIVRYCSNCTPKPQPNITVHIKPINQ